MLYRDLKPENIFIDIDGHIKLADFGLSKVQSVQTLNDTYCGSAEYMSPEMLNGECYSYGIDYYSLGAVLYEMVTGLPPFYSTDQSEMFRSALYKELEYNEQLICPQLADLLKMMLDKDPKKRITKGEAHQIKQHPWCADIDWVAIYHRRVPPPHVPSLSSSNFDPEYVRETSTMSADGIQAALQRPDKSQKRGRQRCAAVLDQSMTSIHSYFYQDHDVSGVSDFIKGTNAGHANLGDESVPAASNMTANAKHSQSHAHVAAKAATKNITKKHRQLQLKHPPASQQNEKLFNDFVYTNPDLPERDLIILKQLQEHRSKQETLQLKRHSHQNAQSTDLKNADLMKSPTEFKSLKMQVLQKQQIFSSQSLVGLSKNLGQVHKSQV